MQNGGSTWTFACSVPVARQIECLAKDRTQALCGVVGFRSLGRLPFPWQQCVQFVPLGPSRYDAFEYIGEPSQWIDIVELRRLNQGGDDCPMPPAAVGAGEQGVLSTKNNRGAILPISAKKWRSITAGTRCMAARSGSSTPSSDLEERLSSLRLNRVWRSCLPPGCLILPFARRCRLALRRSTLLA